MILIQLSYILGTSFFSSHVFVETRSCYSKPSYSSLASQIQRDITVTYPNDFGEIAHFSVKVSNLRISPTRFASGPSAAAMAGVSSSRKMTTDRRAPFMIGVAGGTASGKSTVCERLMEGLGQNEVSVEEKQVGMFLTMMAL